MKIQKTYQEEDKMISLIRDNYDLLQSLGSFGIHLGFGDKTVREVCEQEQVDTYTFLTVVNFTINGYRDFDDTDRISLPTLVKYLRASHEYYLGYQLPAIRRELERALDESNNLARLIMKLHHGQNELKLRELKSIIIKYLPSDSLHNNQLTATLYNLYNCERWLSSHAEVEDHIFIPAVRRHEKKLKRDDVSVKISSMLGQNADNGEALSDRERDVVIGVVQGMTNKEIADHLCISTNTVITHRRNIARKLQIHSPAGLTIYAIVNHLVDISAVKL